MTMSKKQDRAWFVCPQWPALVSGHYASDAEAALALRASPKVRAKLREQTPVARSTLLHLLQAFAGRHAAQAPVAGLVIDTRSR
jgi:septal ring-binding cell division protein DamX